MKKKYIRFKYVGFVVFSERLNHADVAVDIMRRLSDEPMSAGFFYTHPDTGKAWCYGRSVGLNLDSREDDSEALDEFLKRGG